MITLKKLQKIFDNGYYSYYNKIDGNTISVIILKYPYTDFQITVVSKENPNHIKEIYGSLGPFDAFDIIRELLSPINDK